MSDPSATPRMTIDQLETVLAMASTNPNLAKQLHDDPVTALGDLNVPSHPTDIAFFRSLSLASYAIPLQDAKPKDAMKDGVAEC